MTTDVPTGVRGLTPEQLQRLADRLKSGRRGGRPGAIEPRAEPVAPAPLSFSQERFWLLDRLDPGTSVYNVPAEIELRGELRPRALKASLEGVVRRHESLRTSFVEENGLPLQRVAADSRVALPVVDLTGLGPGPRRLEARRLASAHAGQSFDLERGPLLAAALLRLEPARHRLLLTFHHIVCDGWSAGLLVRELSALYGAHLAGRAPDLPELPVQYADFAAWQRAAIDGELAAGLDDWVERLQGAPTHLDLPTDRPRPATQTYHGGRRHRTVPADEADALREFLRGRRATLASGLLAALAVVLGRHAGRDDLVFGMPTAGRDRTELEGLIGDFLNLLALRVDLSGDPGFGELVDRTRETMLEAFAHQRVPFEAILSRLSLDRDLSRTPLFQVLLNVLNLPEQRTSLPGLEVEVLSELEVPSKFDLTLYVTDAREIRLTAVFNADLFDPARIEDLLAQLLRVLAAGVASPERPVGWLSLVTEAARRVLPDPEAPLAARFPDAVHERFLRHARDAPDRVAVRDGAGHWTYGAVAAATLRMVRTLRDGGVGSEDVVAIYAHRGAPLVPATLGVLAAGAAFALLDPAYPPAWLARMLGALRPRGWVEIAGAGRPAPEVAEAVERADPVLRLSWSAPDRPVGTGPEEEPLGAAVEPVQPGSRAYVASTSGSTGVPKLICGAHGPLPHFLDWHADRLGLGSGDRVGALSGLSHDPFLRDLFTPLWSGGTLCFCSSEVLEAPVRLRRWLRRERVTVVHLTPAHAVLLASDRGDGSEEPLSLRWAVFGGDRLRAGDVRQLRRLAPHLACGGYYGATETPQGMGWHEIAELPGSDAQVLPLGRGIDGVQLQVLGPGFRSAGVGELGEVCIRTPCLARGYLDAPATAARFVPDPSVAAPGGRIYRTGDLGRYLPTGDVAFAGRLDRQVKVRGVRIEPGAVEEALTTHPAVRDALVVALGSGADGRLIAYVATGAEPAPDDAALRRHLRRRLPDALVPALYVALESLPRTPDGKLDREALPDPQANRVEAPYRSPRDPVEEMLAAHWAELLDLPRVGIDDDFFALGGHSLLAPRISAGVRRDLGVEMPLRWLFERPTVRGLAERVTAARLPGEVGRSHPIVPVSRDRPLPLSFSQQRLWFLDRLEPGRATYVLPAAYRIEGTLDARALVRSLGEIVRRHAVLRSRFSERDGSPVLSIAPASALAVPFVDLSGLPPGARDGELLRLARQESFRPFDLGSPPLVRAQLLRLAPGHHAGLFQLHHIAGDGWSIGLLIHELTTLYRAAVEGEPSPLPELAIQYPDFARWQRGWLVGPVREAQVEYWRERLRDVPIPQLPVDRPRPPRRSGRGSIADRRIGAETARGLTEIGRRLGATRFMTLLAAWKGLLYRYSGEEDLAVGTPVANRFPAETEPLIGFFVNTLVLRTDLGGAPSFRDLAARVAETAREAFAHQDLPFEVLVAELQPERRLGTTPLFQTMFSVLDETAPVVLPGVELEPLGVEAETAKFDLMPTLDPDGDGLILRMGYALDLFDRTTIVRLLGHFKALAEAVCRQPDRPVAELPLFSAAEYHQLVVEWGLGPGRNGASAGVPEQFAARAAAAPDALAVASGPTAVTYGELDRRSGRLAAHLVADGTRPGDVVGICARRSPDLIAALLGVWRAGAAHVPLDPAAPSDRLRYMLSDAGANRLLVDEGLEVDPPEGVRLLPLHPGETAASAPPRAIATERPAYVLYTSGTTGRPKGVLVGHGALAHTLAAIQDEVAFGPEDRMPSAAPFSFDIFLFEVFGPLLAGGSVSLLSLTPTLDLDRLLGELEAATRFHAVPALMDQVIGRAEELAGPAVRFGGLREVYVGGDAVPPNLLERMAHAFPSARRRVLYGPTEGTILAASLPVADGGPRGFALGRPLPATALHLLDGHLQPPPIGGPGEVCIGGPGVAQGYRGRPGPTAEGFVPSGGLPDGGFRRLYRTGDLARRRPDGSLEFFGRADRQLKLRGVRIEPAEIEQRLASHPRVARAVVVAPASDGAPASTGRPAERLVGFYETLGESVDEAELKASLAGELPGYMVPERLVAIEGLPLTRHGKVDHEALAALAASRGDAPSADRAPEPAAPVVEIVAEVWSELLERPAVSPAGDFFALGGHSLLATRAVSRLREVCGVEIPLRELFEHPTAEALGRRIEELRAATGGAPPRPPIRRIQRPDGGYEAPLSFAQQRLWFLDQLEPGSWLYNLPTFVRLRGSLDAPALAAALGEILRRHEALRTVLPSAGGEPVQRIEEPGPFQLPVIDLSALDAERGEPEAGRLASEEARRPFDLALGPLFRGLLVRLRGPGEREAPEHLLLLTMHHVVSDGWSMEILLRELAALYPEPGASGAALPELSVQYADYAVWQREWLTRDVMERQLAYWREQLASAPEVLDLPLDRPRPSVRTVRGGEVAVRLPPALEEGLRAVARRHGATLFMVLLGGFQALLARLTGQLDLCVGTPVAGRSQPETQDLIGFFVNTLVMRARLDGASSAGDHVARTRASALDAFTHQDVPFERLVDELVAHRDPGYTPLVQVMFAMQSRPPALPRTRGLEMAPVHQPAGIAKFDLTWTLRETAGGLEGLVEYNADLFDRTTVRRWTSHLERLLQGFVEVPGRAVADLPWLGPAEVQQVAREWSGRSSGYPRDRSLAELFEEQVDLRPEAVALSSGERSLTFAEIEHRSRGLARRLRGLGVRADVPVAVLADRSPATVTALLAVVRAGGAYVPLDPAYPAERLAYMLEDSGAAVLLVVEGAGPAADGGPVEAVLSRVGRRVAVVDAGAVPGDGAPSAARLPSRTAAPENRAYVLYTSGTTGPPKGVDVPQRAVARLVLEADYVPLGPGARISLASNLSFDAATFELWGALLNGGCLVVAPAGPMALGELGDLLERHRVTTTWITTSLFNQMVDGALEPLRGVPYVLTGGEVLSASHARRLVAAASGLVLNNCYGPTENTTFTSFQPLVDLDAILDPVPIGRPISDTSIRVLDSRSRPAPTGVAGELCAAGDGLARGYHRAPRLTAERFAPDPLASSPGERLYRTGDLARFRPDGAVDFLGRLDHQVKLRGFRIEPGEVEARLVRHPGVRQAVVLVRESSGGDPRLAAFLVREGGTAVTGAELRAHLAAALPQHMVPAELVWLDALPLNENGKVDRKALQRTARAETASPPAGPPEEAPRTFTERQVAQIWSEVLEIPRPGRSEDFFDRGGHSLLATQVVSRIRDAFGVELPLKELFSAPTVAGLAAAVEEASRRGAGLRLPPVRPEDRRAGAPLSFGQEWIWVVDQLDPGAAAYPAPLPLRLRGRLEPRALQRAVAAVVERHEILRTRFVADGAGPRQHVQESVPVPVGWIDLGALPPALRDGELRRAARAAVRRPFDLAAAPQLRIHLFCLEGPAGEEHLLLLNLHHIVTDGWSAGILVSELAACYAAESDGVAASLPELPVQYGDYAVWQRNVLSGAAREPLLAYWREQLGGPIPALELPTDRPRGGGTALGSARRAFTLGPELSAELKRLGREEGVTLFVTLLALWKTLLLRYCHQEDLIVGTPSANRNRTELEGLVGYFVNDVAIRTDLGGAPSFRELLHRVHRSALGAHTHCEMPVMELIRELAPDRPAGGGRMPFFQTWFQLQNTPVPSIELSGLELAPFELDPGGAAFDLELLTYETAAAVHGHLVHNRELILPETAAAMIRSLRTLARCSAADPDRPVVDLDLLGSAERHQILREWNPAGPVGAAAGTLPVEERFARWAAKRPDAVAVTCEGEVLSYGELARRADHLARRLLAHGLGVRPRIGLVAPRGVDQVTAILGILESGAAYVPIDPEYPEDRRALLLADAGLDALVEVEGPAPGGSADVRPKGLPVVRLDRGPFAAAAGGGGPVPPPADPDALAYVIYTSGSTGRPKGVMVARRHVARLLDACGPFDPDDAWTLFHSYAFDFSVWELWGALSHGGRLVVAPFHVSRSPEAFRELLVRERVTVLSQTPSAFYPLMSADEQAPPEEVCLRRIVFGGESLEPARLDRWLERHGDRCPELVNMYGITETTVHVTQGRVRRGDLEAPGRGSLIGRPLPDLRVYLLDRRLRPVPRGASGEIFVGGAGVARGYLDRPALTAERFVPDPFAAVTGDGAGRRLYRSGDVGRHRPDGALEHLGRADDQLKVRGFRIEPGEIEAALVDHPAIDGAAVLAVDRGHEDRRLVAFVVCRDAGSEPTEVSDGVRRHLALRLPAHMIPGEIVSLPELPLTPHGKVDRRALESIEPRGGAAPDELRPGEDAPSSPAEEVLARIWCELLGIDRVGRERTFFELGGHSLLMTRVSVRLRELFGVSLPMKSFFEGPTLSHLGRELVRRLADRLSEERLEELVARVRRLPDDAVAARTEETRRALQAIGLGPAGTPAHEVSGPEAHSLRGGRTGAEGHRPGGARAILGRSGPAVRASGRLRRLAEKGDARAGELAALVASGGAGQAPGATIDVVGFPAYERPGLLERGLASYAESAREHGRDTRFVVMDDSIDPGARSEIRRRAAAVARRFGVKVGYAGIEEKRRFAAELAAEADVPVETAVTALLGSEDVFMTAGANRNALLIESLGGGLLCVDDDTVCQAGAPPESCDGITLRSGTVPGTAFFSGSDPGTVRAFRSREEALASVEFGTLDLLAAHDGLLGRELGDVLRELDPQAPVRFARDDGDFLDRLEGGGRVLVTTNGWAGDCGWRSPTFYLLLDESSLSRLVASEEEYRMATASKEIVRYVPTPTFGTGDSFVATLFTGLDNRELLPPFTPSGAGEDMLFGRTVAACYGRGLAGHLPWVARHEPSEFRSFWPGELLRSASGVDHLRILAALYDEFQGDAGAAPEQNLCRLGETLIEIGRLSPRAFDGLVLERLRCRAVALADELRDRIERWRARVGTAAGGHLWVADAERFAELLVEHSARDDFGVPLDFLDGRDEEGARRLCQRLVLDFGVVLVQWPELVAAARRLQARGRTVTEDLA